jgi:hypothetical protein
MRFCPAYRSLLGSGLRNVLDGVSRHRFRFAEAQKPLAGSMMLGLVLAA